METIVKFILFPILIFIFLYIIISQFIVDPTEIDNQNNQINQRIARYQRERDSIDLIKKNLDIKLDSLKRVSIRLDSIIQNDKIQIKRQEDKIRRSLDTLNKYKRAWNIDRKRIEELKKSKRIPSNQETMDFFQKY